MGDFICEERMSSRPTAVVALDGFVAEMRTSSRHGRHRYQPQALPPLPPLTTASTLPTTTTMGPVIQVQQDPNSIAKCSARNDQVLVSLLSNKSKDEYAGILTTSVIKLIHTVLSAHHVASISGAVHVTFHGNESPIEVALGETYGSTPSTTPHSKIEETVSKSIDERSSLQELNLGVEACHFYNQLSPEPRHRDEILSVGSLSPPRDLDSLVSPADGPRGGHPMRLISLNGRCPNSSQDTMAPVYSDSKTDSVYNVTYVSSYGSAFGPDNFKNEYLERVPICHHKPLPRLIQPSLQLQQTINNPPIHENRNAVNDNTPNKTEVVSPDAHDDELCGDKHECAVAMDLSSDRERPPGHDEEVNKSYKMEIMETATDPDCEHNLPSTSCSEDTDSDVPMDLSGDCQIKRDTQTVSEEPDRKMKGNIQTMAEDQKKKTKLPHAPKMFKCKLCHYTFPDGNSLSKHAFHIHQVFMCHHCSRVFTAKNNLKRHIRIHTGLRPYKCSQCAMSFARRDDLKGHQLRHDYNKPFRCSICKKGYTDRACVKNHMIKEHGSRQLHVCPLCGESFDHEDTFSKHKKTHQELLQFACDICPFIGSNNLMAFKHHLLHTRKLFSCKPCNAYFADPFGYTDHIRKHKKNEKYTSYVCCFCDTVLPTYEQFVRHEYSHAHLKLHNCPVCDKQFRSKIMLQEHALVHGNEAGDGLNHSRNLEQTDGGKDDESKTQQDTNCPSEANHVQEGQVLDLTVKKAPKSLETVEEKATVGSSNEKQESFSINGVPRNGYAADFSCSRKVDPAFDYTDDFQQVFGPEKSEPKSEELAKSPSDVRPSYSDRTMTLDYAGQFNFYHDGNGLQASPIAKCTSPNENLPPHSSAFKCYNPPIRGEHRYTPYSGQSKAAELASKFILARGRSAFTQASAMKDIHNSNPLFPREEMERAAGTNTAGIRSFHTGSVQNPGSFSPNEATRVKNITKTEVKPQFVHPVVYGLTGTKYQKDGDIPVQEPHPTEQLRPLKFEGMDAGMAVSDSTRDRAIPELPRTSPFSGSNLSCEICSEVFETFCQLESHSVLTHKRYMCEYCGKGFTSRPNRDRHVRYHTGERPYKCDLCDTAFHRGDDLKYHRTTRHPEAKPFVCNNCAASFTWKRDLDRHVRHSKCIVK